MPLVNGTGEQTFSVLMVVEKFPLHLSGIEDERYKFYCY